MKFNEAVKHYLGHGEINEMAIKHLKGTEEYWAKGDLNKVAEIYIQNAKEDGKTPTNIVQGLGATFKAKQFTDKREDVDKVKELIKAKVGPLPKAPRKKKEAVEE